MVKKKVIPATKKLGKELLRTASQDHELSVCACVRVSNDAEEQLDHILTRYKEYIVK